MKVTAEYDIGVSQEIDSEALQRAERKAKEVFFTSLQQDGELTFREAAAGLGINYTEYMDLLNRRGLPASCDYSNPEALAAIRAGFSNKRDAAA